MDLELGTLDKLPAEILLLICSHLPYRDRVQFKLVSKRCYQVSSVPHLWREITWTNFSSSETQHIKAILNKYTAFINNLVVSGHLQLTDFSADIAKCSSLKVLVLLGLRTNISELNLIVAQLPLLEHLEIEPQNSRCTIESCEHLLCFPDEWREFLSCVADIRTVALVVPDREAMIEFVMQEWGSHNYYPVKLNLRIYVLDRQTIFSESPHKSPFTTTLKLWKFYQHQMPSCDHEASFQVHPYRSLPSFGLKIPPVIEIHLTPSNLNGLIVATVGGLDVPMYFIETSQSSLVSACIPDVFTSENQDLPESVVWHNLQSIPTNHLAHLNLSGASNSLLSEHLEIIASSSPSLTHLNLSTCINCFSLLFGLAGLAAKCFKLKALNIQQIPINTIESMSDFWRYLSMFGNLIHLAMNMCHFHTASTIPDCKEHHFKVATNILELELLGSDLEAAYNFHPFPPPELMSHWDKLRHLRVEATVSVSHTVIGSISNGALVHCKALRCLYVASPFSFELHPGSLTGGQLKQLCVYCQRLNMSDSLVDSIVLCKLTHLFLAVCSISKKSVLAILEKAHTLVSCSINTHYPPVFTPPSAVLELRKKMQDIVNRRKPSLDDFNFEEGVISTSPLWNKSSCKMALNSDLITIWNPGFKEM